MVEGFSLELQMYCSYCGDFEPNIEKVEVTSLGEEACSYMTIIKCRNAYRCLKISENLDKRKKQK